LNFDKEAREAIERIYKLYKSKKITIAEIKKELKKYNKEVEEKIALGLLAIDKELNLADIKLSKLLYNNANKIAYKINAVLNEAKRFNRTYKEASRRIYDGYNSGIELLDAKKVLPKYFYEAIDKKKLAKEIEKLQSKNLKAGYKELEKYLKSGSDKALQNLLYVAYNEKLRYYADRIAKTELHRATTNKRAREYLEDSHVEYVRFEMSSSHPKVDICDYYANIDYGYGAGIIKKEDMVTLPLHPNCHCVYAPYYGKVKKKAVKDPVKKVMDKFNSYDKRQILGSYANVDRYYAGTNPLKIFNEVRPDYPIEKFSVGYNGGMETIFSEKVIDKKEKEAIQEWTKDSSQIKQVMWGILQDEEAEKYADTLFGLFDKYASNVEKGKTLYRGMSIPEDIFFTMGYDKLKKGDRYTPDDKAISSFSASKKVAYDFAKDGNFEYRVILKIKSHNQDLLDISESSTVAKEEETILAKKVWYNVMHIKKYERGGEKWMLVVLKKI